MQGCSQGGRQGMMLAQRFPWDFNGIIAGAPGRGDLMAVLWAAMALNDRAGRSIVDASDLRLVNQTVVQDCDLDDGVKDGIIGDPRACRFDPSELLCKGAKTATCLTAEQAAAIRKVYIGAVTSKGERVEPGASALKGSELNWIGSLITGPNGPGVYEALSARMFRYVNFYPDAGPGWKVSDFDWDKDPRRMGVSRALQVATNPDLRQFRDAGGKLLSYKGWADELMPEAVTDYYDMAVKAMGGPKATEDFYRLFMLPGVNHCSGGAGADVVDYLTSLENWVEKGRAPDVLIGAQTIQRTARPVFPIDPAQIKFTRPYYPYPVQTRYRGKGDPNSAASFEPFVPKATK